MKSMKSPLSEGSLVRSLLTLAGGAATLPLAVSPADAAIIVDSSLNGTVIGWNTTAIQTPATTLVLPGASINIRTRATAAGAASSSGFIGVVVAGANFRKSSSIGLNAAYLAPFGAAVNAGTTAHNFANINLGDATGNAGNAEFSSPSKYLLFSFTNTNTSVLNFGWIELTATTTGQVDSKSNYSATLGSWAYDDSGIPITAGAVPEPSSAMLFGGALVAGAVGLRRWRKQRDTSGQA